MTDNPLLQLSSLPDFAMIQPQHIAPAIRQLLEETDAERQRLEADLEPTWTGLMEPLEQLENRLSLAWGAVGHLMGVKNSEALRQAHQEVQGEVVQFWMRLGQSQAIYQGLKSLQASGEWTQLDAAQQRIVDISIKDADLSGVGLQGDARTRFNAIQQELAELSTSFSNHLLDATKAFHLDLHQPEDIGGLPPSLLGHPRKAGQFVVGHVI
jgi:oligopeptidase A